MAYTKISGKAEYDALLERVMSDATQLGIGISQLVEGKYMPVLGALAGGDKKSRERKLLSALAIHRQGELLRDGYFMPLLVDINILMKRAFDNHQFAKNDKLKGQLGFFYATYQILRTISKGALVLFDAYYDQWYMLTIMGFRPPDKAEDGRMTWMTADVDVLETVKKRQRISRRREKDAGRYVRPDPLPTFREAFEEARQIAEEMSESDSPLSLREAAPDLDELSSRIDELAEVIARESKQAEDAKEKTSTRPREIMIPAEDESDE